MAWKKIKLDEQVISEILVADSDSKSGSEPSNLEVSFEEEEGTNNNSKPQQKLKQRLQRVDYQPGDHLKEGTQRVILLSVQQKV